MTRADVKMNNQIFVKYLSERSGSKE